MKYIRWKSLVITVIICILPVLYGITLWNELPYKIAIHFNLYNQPDNFVSKEFAVFGIPVMMSVLQIICCVINDINFNKDVRYGGIIIISKMIIPVITVALYIFTLGYSAGWSIDMRIIAGFITGILLIVTGIYSAKLDFVKNYNISADKAKKINRFSGYTTVIMGCLMLLSLLLPPIATVIWLFLLIPYCASVIIYGIITRKKQG